MVMDHSAVDPPPTPSKRPGLPSSSSSRSRFRNVKLGIEVSTIKGILTRTGKMCLVTMIDLNMGGPAGGEQP